MSIQGAIPLKSNSTSGGQGRLDLIPNDLPTKFNVGGVISVNQEFERVVTLSFDEWQAKDVELLKVDCADFNFAPSREDLIRAATFMDTKISDGKSVYVHCKAGRTRSATIVAAYLILHQNHTGKQQNKFKIPSIKLFERRLKIHLSRISVRFNEKTPTACYTSRSSYCCPSTIS